MFPPPASDPAACPAPRPLAPPAPQRPSVLALQCPSALRPVGSLEPTHLHTTALPYTPRSSQAKERHHEVGSRYGLPTAYRMRSAAAQGRISAWRGTATSTSSSKHSLRIASLACMRDPSLSSASSSSESVQSHPAPPPNFFYHPHHHDDHHHRHQPLLSPSLPLDVLIALYCVAAVHVDIYTVIVNLFDLTSTASCQSSHPRSLFFSSHSNLYTLVRTLTTNPPPI